jgi:hypothetical protein
MAITGWFLCPSVGYAAAATDQVFPPLLPNGSQCPKGTSLALVWDGVTNVQCLAVPTCNPGLGQGLTFNQGTFSCVTPCIPQPVMITSGQPPCPSGETGSPTAIPAMTSCVPGAPPIPTGAPSQNTCSISVPVATTAIIQCAVGTTMYGAFDGTGNLNSELCTANPSACSSYTCSAGGLVPQ